VKKGFDAGAGPGRSDAASRGAVYDHERHREEEACDDARMALNELTARRKTLADEVDATELRLATINNAAHQADLDLRAAQAEARKAEQQRDAAGAERDDIRRLRDRAETELLDLQRRCAGAEEKLLKAGRGSVTAPTAPVDDAPAPESGDDQPGQPPLKEPDPAAPRCEEPGADEVEPWTGGGLEPYEVGDPGRAAREVIPAVSGNPSDPPDTQVDGARVGPLVVRAASTRGTSHRYGGTPRQDDYALCIGEESWLVVAVADGVSAGSLSHLAARIACRGAAELVRDALVASNDVRQIPWEDVLQTLAGRIVGYGRRSLASDGDADEVTARDVADIMATTLVVAAVSLAPSDDGSHEGIAAAVGDTSVFLLDAASAWCPVTAVKNEGAQVASSATMALPHQPREVHALDLRIEPGERLFVMTDGVGDPLGRGDGDVGRFLATVWAQPPDILSFGGQVGFARRSYDDDRTVVGIWVPA
jgi:hypothetical protein